MDNLIIIFIIGVYGAYKVLDRAYEHKELLENEDDNAYAIIDKLIDENRELMERLLEKEVEDEDRV